MRLYYGKIAGYLTKNRSEKDQKIAQSTHENEYIKPRKTFWRNSKQLLSSYRPLGGLGVRCQYFLYCFQMQGYWPLTPDSHEYPQPTPVGAYRIRPENIHVDKWTHTGVCDTPLHGMFADFKKIHIFRWVVYAKKAETAFAVPASFRLVYF